MAPASIAAPVIELPERPAPIHGLAPGADHDGVVLASVDLSGQRGHDLRLTASRLVDVTMGGVALSGALIAECRLERIAAADLDLVGARLRDVEVTDGRFGGLLAHGAELTRVTIRNSRLGYVNLRASTLVDLRFVDCRIVELDVTDATLRRVAVDGCVIECFTCQHADMREADLTNAQIGEITDPASLRGAVISTAQLAVLAPALADHLGITVREPA